MSGNDDDQGNKHHSKHVEDKGGPMDNNESRSGGPQFGQSSRSGQSLVRGQPSVRGQSSFRGRGLPPRRGRSSGRGDGGADGARERTPDPGVTYSAAVAGGLGGFGNPWQAAVGRGGFPQQGVPSQQAREREVPQAAPRPRGAQSAAGGPRSSYSSSSLSSDTGSERGAGPQSQQARDREIPQAAPRPRGAQSAAGGPRSSYSSSSPSSDTSSERGAGPGRAARESSPGVGASGSMSQVPGDRPLSNMNVRARAGQHNRSSSDSSDGGVQLFNQHAPSGRIAPPNTRHGISGRATADQRVEVTLENPINADSNSDVVSVSSRQARPARSPGTLEVIIPVDRRQGRGRRGQKRPFPFNPNDPSNRQGGRRDEGSGGGAAGGVASA